MCGCFVAVPTVAQQLGVGGLLEDDDGGPQGGEGHVQAAAAGQGPQLGCEVLQVGRRRAAEELEHVVVEALGPRAVHHQVGHGQHLTGGGVLVGTH